MIERWEKEILPQIQTLYRQEEVDKLLARQHRAMVRKIKSLPTYDPAAIVSGMQRIDQGQWVKLDTVLAALAKQGGGKK